MNTSTQLNDSPDDVVIKEITYTLKIDSLTSSVIVEWKVLLNRFLFSNFKRKYSQIFSQIYILLLSTRLLELIYDEIDSSHIKKFRGVQEMIE